MDQANEDLRHTDLQFAPAGLNDQLRRQRRVSDEKFGQRSDASLPILKTDGQKNRSKTKQSRYVSRYGKGQYAPPLINRTARATASRADSPAKDEHENEEDEHEHDREETSFTNVMGKRRKSAALQNHTYYN